LFCRIIEKREEHQRNVQIHTIPETVLTNTDLGTCAHGSTSMTLPI